MWRVDIVLATADGLGTNAIMRRTGKSKPCAWRWQERYIDEGVPGLLRDNTRRSRIAPLSAEKKLAIIEKTATEKPANATRWSAPMHLTGTFHPPAGIDPLVVVVNDMSWGFLVAPVGIGAMLLALFAFTWHKLVARGANRNNTSPARWW